MTNQKKTDLLASFNKKSASRSEVVDSKPVAQFWINVGIEIEISGTPTFVSLPLGIPLDNLEPVRVPNSDSDYKDLCLVKNHLLALLKSKASELQPGDSELLLNASVQLYRKQADQSDSSPSGVDLTKISW